SFAFHTAERFEGHFTGLHIERMKAFVVDTGSLLGPFIIPAIISFFLRRQKNPFERVGKTLAGLTFILSTGTFLYIANYAWVMWWWNVAAFVLILPFLGRVIGRFMLVMHVLWGGAISTALTVSFAILPITLLVGQPAFMETESGYGWDRIV